MTLIRNFVFIVILYFSMSILFLNLSKAQSSDCSNCNTLAKVSLTNQGLAHLLETALISNFQGVNALIKNRSGFRPITLDQSNCPNQTLKEALTQKKEGKDVCFGLPDLKDHIVSGQTSLRPYTASLDNYDIRDMQLKLATPLKCENLRCRFKVHLTKLDVAAALRADYADKKESFIPPTRFTLKTQDNPDITLSVEASLDPSSGQLNNLVILSEDKTNLNIKPGSLHLDMDFKTKFASPADEQNLKGKQYRLQTSQMLPSLKTPSFVKNQIEATISQMAFARWSRNHNSSISLKSFESDVRGELIQQYGSIEALQQKILNMPLPTPTADSEILQFMKNPPAEMAFLPQFKEKLQSVEIGAMAENSGFTSQQGFEWAMLATASTNIALEDDTLLKQLLLPLILKEVGPAIAEQANLILRNLQNSWDQISVLPSLNLTNFARLSDLRSQFNNASDAAEKNAVALKIANLKQQMAKDWVPLESSVAISDLTHGRQMLQAHINSGKTACPIYPDRTFDPKDNQFDLRTEVGVPLFQKYFDAMADNKKLDACFDSENPVTCEGGKLLKFKKAPEVVCQNGKFVLNLDAEAQKSFLAIGLEGQLTATLTNCGGNACFQLSDARGQIKNAFLNTFLGGLVNTSLVQVAQRSDRQPISVPHASLKKYQTDPTTCQTKLDWDIQP